MNDARRDHARAWLEDRASAPAESYAYAAGLALVLNRALRHVMRAGEGDGHVWLIAAAAVCAAVVALRSRLGGPASLAVTSATVATATIGTWWTGSPSLAAFGTGAAIFAFRDARNVLEAAIDLAWHPRGGRGSARGGADLGRDG